MKYLNVVDLFLVFDIKYMILKDIFSVFIFGFDVRDLNDFVIFIMKL